MLEESSFSPAKPLAGRVALVTGGGRGIGRGIAVRLAAEGARVLVTSRTRTDLDETVTDIQAAGGQVSAFPADVASPDDVANLARFAREWTDHIDIVVNNAGNLIVRPLVTLPLDADGVPESMDRGMTYAEWRSLQAVHLDGAFHVLREFGPGMLERRQGRVINIVSSALGRAVPFTIGYDVAKAGLAQLTRSLAYEWAQFGVCVNAIAVGQVRTRMTERTHDEPATRRWLLRRIPMRRVGELTDVATLAAYLAGDGAAFITGQVIGVDGGESL